MDERQWLTTPISRVMLEAVADKGTPRLWRLYAVACVRTFEDRMRYAGSRKALDVAERLADGLATLEELRAARAEARAAEQQARLDEWQDELRVDFGTDEAFEAVVAAREAAEAAVHCLGEKTDSTTLPEGLRLPDPLREVFRNPFRPAVFDPLWLCANDGEALRLAESIYESRSFDLLPILADALEDVGCTNADLLDHLRSPGPHVRGCWALDLVLGKS